MRQRSLQTLLGAARRDRRGAARPPAGAPCAQDPGAPPPLPVCGTDPRRAPTQAYKAVVGLIVHEMKQTRPAHQVELLYITSGGRPAGGGHARRARPGGGHRGVAAAAGTCSTAMLQPAAGDSSSAAVAPHTLQALVQQVDVPKTIQPVASRHLRTRTRQSAAARPAQSLLPGTAWLRGHGREPRRSRARGLQNQGQMP